MWCIVHSNTCAQWYASASSEEINNNSERRNNSMEWNLRVLVPGHEALRPSHFAIQQLNNIHVMPRSLSSMERALVHAGEFLKLISTTIPHDAQHICQLHNYTDYSVHLIKENRVVYHHHEINNTENGKIGNNKSFLSTKGEFLYDKYVAELSDNEEECGVYKFGSVIIADKNDTNFRRSSRYALENNKTYTIYVYEAKPELPLRLLDLHDRCVNLPYNITKAVVHVLSDKHVVITMHLVRRMVDNNTSLEQEEQEVHVPCQFVIEAWREENADNNNYNTSNKTKYTTILLLLIVIVVRFVPRYVLRRRGQINATSFHGRHVQRVAEARRRKLLQMQHQLIEKMKAEDNYEEHTHNVKSNSVTDNNRNDDNKNENVETDR